MGYVRWLWSDPETMAPVGGPVLLTEQQFERWYAAMVDPGRPANCYCLILDQRGRPVGEISFHHLDPTTMTARFNLKIAHPERGQGYAREAMRLFLDFFFNHFGGRLLLDDVALDNRAGQQALLRFGFEHDPSREDVFLLRLTREQFNEHYGGGLAWE